MIVTCCTIFEDRCNLLYQTTKQDFENFDGQFPGCPSRGYGPGNWRTAMLETNGLVKNVFVNEIIQVSNENQFCFSMLHKNFF